jgi:hypothetical protein
MFRRLAMLMLLSMVVGCMRMPGTTEIRFIPHDRTFSCEYDTVWWAVNQFFEDEYIEIETIEKRIGLIVTKEQFFDPEWTECEEAPKGVTIYQSRPKGQIDVFLKDDSGEVWVMVLCRYWVTRSGCYTEWSHYCKSTGVMEESLLTYIEKYCKTQQDAISEPTP